MPSILKQLRPTLLYSGTAVTATFTNPLTGVTKLPIADAYKFILDVGTVSGTTPTLDLALQESPDGGTTWYTFARFAQAVAAGQRYLVMMPTLSVGQAASENAIGTTGALAINQPFLTQFVRVQGTIGGTTPSFASIKVWLVSIDAGNSR